MTQNKTAIVLGSTGLVGSNLVSKLIQDNQFSYIKTIVRRPSNITHPKIKEYIVKFDELSPNHAMFKGDVLFSCLGTTIKNAGSKNAQYKVDFTYQYEVAKNAVNNGVQDYVLVSSANANSNSKVFYSRMKGELDSAIQELSFERTIIFRPSVLMGKREEKRIGEEIGSVIINALGKLIPSLKKYRGIKGEEVARAMIVAYKAPVLEKVNIFNLDEIFKLIN
jgi:uncharacterized protein YbjT (DUF2867 family)